MYEVQLKRHDKTAAVDGREKYTNDIEESALWHEPGPFRDQCPLFRFENAALCMAFSAIISGPRPGHI